MSRLSYLTEDEQIALENIAEAEEIGDSYDPCEDRHLRRACEDLAKRGLAQESDMGSYTLTYEGREMVP